jgi:hypothetical protein
MEARSEAGVSPLRTAAVILTSPCPISSAKSANLAPRLGEVLVDVGGERLQRRDVDHPGLVRQGTAQRFSQQLVQLYQKGGERLA